MTPGLPALVLAATTWTSTAEAASDLADLPLPSVAPRAPRSPDAAPAADWATLAPHLRVRPYAVPRLGPDDRAAILAAVGRPLPGSVRLAVVLDTPDHSGVVRPEALVSWGRSEAEVFQRALAQTHAVLAPRLQHFDETLPSSGGSTVAGELWTGGDTVSMLADLAAFAGPAPSGYLVTAPSRTMVVLHRLQAAHPVDPPLATFAALTAVGPPDDHEPFSDTLYWWYAGTLHPLQVVDPVGGPPAVVADATLQHLRRTLAGPAPR